MRIQAVRKNGYRVANYTEHKVNSSHSYAVALDSIYGAYLKANYPYEFYEVMLEFYSDKKDNEKVSSIIHEMEYHFEIMMGTLGFGYDNRRYTADKENKVIYPSLLGVKYINREVAEYLYELGKNKNNMNFYQIYDNLKLSKVINKRHIETLMKIKYFNEYGSPHKLIRWMTALNENFAKKQYNKEKVDERILQIVSKFAKTETEKLYKDVDYDALSKYIFDLLPETEFQAGEQLRNEIELAGKLLSEIPDGCTVGEVVARSWKKDVFLFKSWKNNQEVWVNTYTKENMPNRGDIVLLHSFQVETKRIRGKERKDYTAEVYTLRKGK